MCKKTKRARKWQAPPGNTFMEFDLHYIMRELYCKATCHDLQLARHHAQILLPESFDVDLSYFPIKKELASGIKPIMRRYRHAKDTSLIAEYRDIEAGVDRSIARIGYPHPNAVRGGRYNRIDECRTALRSYLRNDAVRRAQRFEPAQAGFCRFTRKL